MKSVLLRNATAVTLDPPAIKTVDMRIKAGVIIEIGKNLASLPGEESNDLRGKIVMPGFVNAHTHLYSSLVRGMPGPAARPKNFTDILKKIWWRIDRALDEEAIYYSALIGCIEALHYGTSTVIDHHASPNAIPGSLEIIKQAMNDTGMRGVLCYETSDRDGIKRRDEGLLENERFVASNAMSSRFRGLVGAHASFTLSDDSLHQCGQLAQQYKTGVHIHVAEAVDDAATTRKKYRNGILERLSKHGISGKSSIFAHVVHLSAGDFKRVRKSGTWLVHNPRSNMNNQVGLAPLQFFGERVALGTDGFPADMFEEAATGFFRIKDAGLAVDAALPAKFLNGGQRLASQLFGKSIGSLSKGSVADIIVMDYCPPTPMTAENLTGHFLFGMKSAMVDSVMVEGKWVVKDRRFTDIDTEEAFRKASAVAKKMWKRTEKIA